MRKCKNCDTEISSNKIYCSNVCRGNFVRKLNIENYKKDPKRCKNCNKSIPYDDKNSKIFCDNSCSATYNNRLRESKIEYNSCTYCGEDTTNDKYCSNKCQGKYIRSLIFEKIENGDTTQYEKSYRNYLIDKYGAKCMKCGWDEIHPVTGNVPIELDHIDGDHKNNSLDNLRLLCPNCHSLTPTYKALNSGNGRDCR